MRCTAARIRLDDSHRFYPVGNDYVLPVIFCFVPRTFYGPCYNHSCLALQEPVPENDISINRPLMTRNLALDICRLEQKKGLKGCKC